MTRTLRLAQRLILYYVLFAAILLALVGALATYSGRQALEAATVSDLESTANEKQAALDSWLSDRLGALVALTDSLDLKQKLADFVAANPNLPAGRAARDRVVEELYPETGTDKQFLAISVIEPETGRVIAATDPDEEGKFRESQAEFTNGKTAASIVGPYYSLQYQSPIMTVVAPLRSSGGQLLGILVGRLNLSQMTSIIQRRTNLHQTDDAFLVNASSLFITQPRFLSDPVILQQGVHTIAVKQCLTRNSGVVPADDYRGVTAIVVYR